MPENEVFTPETESIITPVNPETNTALVMQPKKKSVAIYVLLALVAILFVSSMVFAALYFKVVELPLFSTAPSVSPTPVASPMASLLPSSSPVTQNVISWLSKPEVIASIQLTKPQEELATDYNYYLTNKTEYRVVGTMQDKTKVLSMTIPCDGMMCDLIVYCLVNDTKAECLTSGLNEYDQKTVPALLKSSVTFKNNDVKGITAPATLTVKGVTLHLGNRYSGALTDIPKTEFFEDTVYGKLYRGFTPLMESIDLVARNFYLLLGDGSLFTYSYSNKPYDITSGKGFIPAWTNGVTSTESMTQSLASGCGSSMLGSVPIYRGNLPTPSAVAKATNGDVLYQSASSDDAMLVDSLYGFYKLGRDTADSGILTLDQFMSKKDVYVLWKDTLGDWQVFMSNTYAPLVECGKPVIYLYPTQTTPVAVQVGATIRMSEPTYPQGGWQVVAEPNGSLIYQQRTYPYLFWEGKGTGEYPDYQNRGEVVTQKQLVPSLYKQMTALGLTTKEAADFMEFWQPRLPRTPYVRLTWLGTDDMDRLAPLTVSPTPDTKIRVFLEFEGLAVPKTLIPQHLSSPKRVGFTLVEWGGLLIGE